jgi:predicted ferric reductase
MSGRAAFWTILYLAIIFVPLLVLLFVGEDVEGAGFWLEFSVALGFAATAMIGAQFWLTARFRRATHPFGIDVLYYFHRILAIAAVAFLLGHWGILFVFFRDALGPIDPREAPLSLTLGRVALGCFVLLVVTSEFRRRLRLEYGLWRYLHVGLAVIGFGAAIAHIVMIGRYTEVATKGGLWLAITLSFLGLVVWTRIGKPLRQLGAPWRIVENRPERGGAYTLVLEPEGHGGLGRRWRPGQFSWLTFRASPFALREHPFSMANPPEEGPRLAFGIKPQGDFTEMAKEARPGEIAYIDGPYGVFTIDRFPEARGFVFVAGGIGITPVLANLRALARRGDTRPVTLFYCNPDWEGVTYREALDALAERLPLRLVHVIEEAPEGWQGETGLLDRSILERHLPADLGGHVAFLCGPAPLTEAAREALEALGVPPLRIESELFELV